ncbi:cytochrome P450 [Ephemerocybe angulata]|uniref:Cytochrome P450 n=1 Tax=Ephemerocybe angulata TaxID=980116 RepID=A0A8H6M900_9AGAR|nr:cytochrome P450 [Tulosesus angulatus]
MSNTLLHPVTIFGLSLLVLYLLKRFWSKRKVSNLPYPPGPKGHLIIGNLFDIGKRETPWIHYSNLSKEYGDMVFLESFGTKLLILSSVERVTDLLDKRSSNYSGRHYLPMLCGEMKYDEFFSNMTYSPEWRKQRRMFHQHFNATVVSRYHPIISSGVSRYVEDITASPQRFRRHIQYYFNRLIFRSFYGVEILEEDDPYIKQGAETMEGFIVAGIPGSFMVDMIPALTYVPKWLPGTGWKDFAEYYRKKSRQARDEPYDHALKSMREGTCEPSVASRVVETLPPTSDPARDEEEKAARDVLTLGYIGSLAAAMTFVLLMALHPEVQKRAQAELDEVVGFGQIPTFEDQPKLVYIDALLRELFRWHSEVPLGLPHTATSDDIYDGYSIPKDTIVVANVWQILRNPAHYDNPNEFNPGRHIKDGQINKDILDPYTVAFGFGRRICPGRHLSLDTLFAIVTATLAMFDISPPKDDAGNSNMKYSFNSEGAVL